MNDTAYDFTGLRALFINCTSQALAGAQQHPGAGRREPHDHGAARRRTSTSLRAIDHDIATGVWPDMPEHGWATDDWPEIFELVKAAHILVMAGPIWLGDNGSVTKQCIERLYARVPAAQRAGAVALLRPRRRLPDHRQRGRHQALRAQRALHAAAHGVHDPAAGRRGLDRRGRPWRLSYLDPGWQRLAPTTTSPAATRPS